MPQKNEKTSRNQAQQQKSHQRDKHQGSSLKYSTILKMDKGGTQTNGPKDKEIDDYAPGLTPERWHRQMIFIKEEEDSSTLRTVDASIQGLKDYIRKSKERLIRAASNSIDNIRPDRKQKLGNRDGKNNKCKEISSNKQMKLYIRKPGHGYEKETSRGKLTPFQ